MYNGRMYISRAVNNYNGMLLWLINSYETAPEYVDFNENIYKKKWKAPT